MAGTGAVVPSDAILDLKENAKTLDEFVSGGSDFVVGRTTPSFPSGKNIRTLTGINAVFDAAQAGQFVADSEAAADRSETAADVAMTAGWVYSDVASGEAVRVDGDYFWVLSTDSNEVLELWQMGATTATDTGKRTNAKKYVTNAYLYSRDRVLSKNTFDTSVNLFNHNDIVDDVVILSDGQVSTNASYKTTGFIEVKENTDYTKSGVGAVFVYAATYDINKNFVRRIDFTSATISTGDNEYFIRLSFQGATLAGNRMLNEGASALPYELHFTEIKRKALPLISGGEVALNGIDPRNTGFIEDNGNLYDSRTVTQDVVILTGGQIDQNSGYSITDYIDVNAGESYSKRGDGMIFTNAAFYDKEKNFIVLENFPGTETGTVVAPDRAKFMRLNFQGSPAAERAIFKGAVSLPYAERKESFENIKLAAKDADFIGTNGNLFDHNDVTEGVVILSNGTIDLNASYSVTGFINVKQETQYSIGSTGVGFTNAAFYDKNKNFISRANVGTTLSPFYTPPNCVYMRMNFQGAPLTGQRMLNEGATPLPYEPKRYYLENVEPYKTDPMPDDVHLIDIPIAGVYSTTETYAAFGNFTSTTSAQVYQLYDDLMAAFPDYITKQFLGNDLYGNPISVYKFTPAKPQATFNNTRYPKVFLTSGVHGYEHVPGLVCFLFFKDICERWQQDSQLEALRHNVEFLIIPVANPSGWDDYTRKNRNGVDINRNFPENWTLGDPASNIYGGPEPLSEVEAQYIKQVFDENPDIDIMYDFHNFSGGSTTEYFIWIPTVSGRYLEHMAQMLIQRMTRKWRKDYSWFPSDPDYFAGYSDATHGAMVQDHAYARGIQFAATFEVCGRWWISDDPTPYNTEHKQSAVDSLTNWILINLEQLLR